jgi:hypothetical protein
MRHWHHLKKVFGHRGKAAKSNCEQAEEGKAQRAKEERNQRREATSACGRSKSAGRTCGKNVSCCSQLPPTAKQLKRCDFDLAA